MDVKIENGGIVRDAAGKEVTVSGFDETVQRVRTVCSLRKGSFRYQRRMGVDTTALTNDERFTKRLELRFREAIVAIPDVDVEVLSATAANDRLTARLWVTSGEHSTETEVTLYGSI